jgi:uncharacterized membrane protein YdjX (TVP38/TMEM64 family)
MARSHAIPLSISMTQDVTHAVIEWVERLGQLNAASALALGLFFTAIGLVVFPRTPFIIAAGATFGLAAAPIILIGGTAGSMLAFALSRYVASGRFHCWLKRHQRLQAVARAVDLEGWRIVALLRLGVPIPNAATNYMLGLTRIGFPAYVLATLIFSSQIVLFCFLGATGRASLLDGAGIPSSLISIALGAVLIALISWRVRSMLRNAMPPSP